MGFFAPLGQWDQESWPIWMLHVEGGNPEKGMACIWMWGYPGPALGGEWDICGHWVVMGVEVGSPAARSSVTGTLGSRGVDLNSSLTAKQGCTLHLVTTL